MICFFKLENILTKIGKNVFLLNRVKYNFV